MDIFASIFLFIISVYLFLLHLFAVIGLVFTVKYLYEKYHSRKHSEKEVSVQEDGVSADIVQKKDNVTTKGFPTPAIIAKNMQTKERDVSKDPLSPLQQQKSDVKGDIHSPSISKKVAMDSQKGVEARSSLLLYTGAVLVGFAVFIFVVFNWESYDQIMKSALLTIFIATFFILSYLFSMKAIYANVSKIFLILGSIALILGGIGYWKFYFQFNLTEIDGGDFWFFYSIILVAVFYFIQKQRESRLFSLFFLFSVYSLIVSLGTSLFDGRAVLELSVILLGSVAVSVLFSKGAELRLKNEKMIIGFSRFFLIFANIILTLTLLPEGFYSIELPEKIIITLALLSPIAYLYELRRKGEDKRLEAILEGLLLPIKGITLANLFLLTSDSYQYLAITLTLLMISVFILLRNWDENTSKKIFPISLFISSILLCLHLPFSKPVYVETLEALPVLISYSVISISIQMLSNKGNLWYLRFFNVPVDLVLFVSILFALEERTSLGLTDFGIVGLFMALPAVLYTWEALLSTGKKRIPLLAGASFFTIFALILTSQQTDLFIFTTLFSVILFKSLMIITRKEIFQIPMVISSYLFIYALGLNFLWEESLVLMLMILFNIFLGLVGPIKERIGLFDNIFINSNSLKYTSLIFAWIFYMINLILLFDLDSVFKGVSTVNSSGEPLVFFSSLLFSVYILLVWRGNRFLRYFAGVGIVPAFWYIVRLSDTSVYANAQLFVFPLMIYSLVLSYLLDKRHLILSKFFFILAYMMPATVALLQSVQDPSPYDLFHALALLFISAAVLVYATLKKERLLSIIAIVYITIELFLLFWETIRSIPWWAYVGLLGLILIGLAVYIIFKYASEPSEEKVIAADKVGGGVDNETKA